MHEPDNSAVGSREGDRLIGDSLFFILIIPERRLSVMRRTWRYWSGRPGDSLNDAPVSIC
jgi:hypothetical protein